ncbi:hypothetical protein HCN44_002393 [Aphidius gifuensis]|uniref:Epimerase family protein SDR39U1 n=1 Tax=Aphidius gifuensis TaxID=684658 RepID=A0A834Y309_APHGI|nr:epimerase family protein SDR39U1 [Aphidius gifuensis]KAF7996747.1 hypothetical protein HCN44_002393 [Aphidius gifuensis]
MSFNHVVIGGGTGWIGTALACALRSQGTRVSIVTRRLSHADDILWDDVERSGLPKSTSAVINVAGVNILDPLYRWNDDFKKQVWDSRIRTTKILTNAIRNSDVKYFGQISGVAYYPPDGKEYSEDDKCQKYDYLSELVHAWEAAGELPNDSKTRKVVIRSGVVLGRTGGMISQIFFPFYLGFGGPIGSGNQYMPWIHISDLVELFIYSIEQEKIQGILNAVAPQLITNKEFTKAFGSAMWRPTIFPLPEFVLNIMFSQERAKIMTDGQKVIPKRTLEYGFEYEFPKIDMACKQFSQIAYAGLY